MMSQGRETSKHGKSTGPTEATWDLHKAQVMQQHKVMTLETLQSTMADQGLVARYVIHLELFLPCHIGF